MRPLHWSAPGTHDLALAASAAGEGVRSRCTPRPWPRGFSNACSSRPPVAYRKRNINIETIVIEVVVAIVFLCVFVTALVFKVVLVSFAVRHVSSSLALYAVMSWHHLWHPSRCFLPECSFSSRLRLCCSRRLQFVVRLQCLRQPKKTPLNCITPRFFQDR